MDREFLGGRGQAEKNMEIPGDWEDYELPWNGKSWGWGIRLGKNLRGVWIFFGTTPYLKIQNFNYPEGFPNETSP